MIGIYKITNLINGKCYIGQSVNVEGRLENHRNGIQSNIHLQNSIRTYGINNFLFEVLEECSEDKLNEREIYWIEYYDSTNRDKGYNIAEGGQGGYLLKSASDEHKKEVYQKISKSKTGKLRGHNSEEVNKKISKGRHTYLVNNPDAKENLIKHLNKVRPKTMSEESRIKLSKSVKGENNPFYGKKHSNESRKKISDAVRKAYAEGRIVHSSGYKMSDKTKEKCRQRMIGNTHSKGKMNGRILVNNGSISKQINPEDLQSYLDQGWVKGRIGKPKSNGREGKIRISNGEKKKFILPEELLNYEAEGWFRG